MTFPAVGRWTNSSCRARYSSSSSRSPIRAVNALVSTMTTEEVYANGALSARALIPHRFSEGPSAASPSFARRSPAPLVHAATKAARKAFYDAYAWFVAAFREAAERLRRGDREAPFPGGSFPPALPFVAG
jgi:hypothetical protein